MADEYDDFDYVPEDNNDMDMDNINNQNNLNNEEIENDEFDYKEKQISTNRQNNINKDLNLSYDRDFNSTNKKTVTLEEDEKYENNFENEESQKTQKTQKTQKSQMTKDKNDDFEDIPFDDYDDNDEDDKKEIKQKPELRNKEISYFEENENININRGKKMNSIGKKVVSEIPQIDQTEFSHIGNMNLNMNNINNNEKFNNSLIQPDIYDNSVNNNNRGKIFFTIFFLLNVFKFSYKILIQNN